MLRSITLVFLAFSLASPAFAATKQEVAAAGCNTLKQVRDQIRKYAPTEDRIKFRLIGDKQCWYSEQVLAKRASPTRFAAEPVKPQIAGKVPASVIKRIIKQQEPTEPMSYEEINPADMSDNLDAVFEIMCGGPCPQLKNERPKTDGNN